MWHGMVTRRDRASSYTKLTRLVFCLHPHDHGHIQFCLLDEHGNGTHLKSGQLQWAAWEHDIRFASLIRPHKMVSATSSRLDFRAAIIYIDTDTIARQWLSFIRLHWITDDYECTSATASWSWGAHLHTFSSPEQSPVKSSPPAVSSMVLTSFLERSVPIPSNLEDSNQGNAELLSVRNHWAPQQWSTRFVCPSDGTEKYFYALTMAGWTSGCNCCCGGSRRELASYQLGACRRVCANPATQSERLSSRETA